MKPFYALLFNDCILNVDWQQIAASQSNSSQPSDFIFVSFSLSFSEKKNKFSILQQTLLSFAIVTLLSKHKYFVSFHERKTISFREHEFEMDSKGNNVENKQQRNTQEKRTKHKIIEPFVVACVYASPL